MFGNDAGGDGEIWVMDANGQNRVQLTSNTTQEFQPAWSPDGTKILFTGIRDANYEIFVANADGSGETNLTDNPGIDQGAVWSPDGQRIAFISTRGGGEHEIYTMNPDGSGLVNLTNNTVISDASPSWSPDGTKLAFSTAQNSDLEIYTMNSDGSARTRVTNHFGVDHLPAWSPDGQRIAFWRGSEIFTVNPDGSGESNVTNHPAFDISPDWQPVQPGYPRPKAAAPLYTPLVIAYRPCTNANSIHAPPLSYESCNPPVQSSSFLTVSNPPAVPASSVGSLRLRVVVGNPSTTADEADVAVTFSLTDVLRQADLQDYTGELRATHVLRITDRDQPFTQAATVVDLPLHYDVDCAATPDPVQGADCSLSTTVDAVMPNTVKEGRRAIWQVDQVQVFDGGADGVASTTADNTLFETQGIFVP